MACPWSVLLRCSVDVVAKLNKYCVPSSAHDFSKLSPKKKTDGRKVYCTVLLKEFKKNLNGLQVVLFPFRQFLFCGSFFFEKINRYQANNDPTHNLLLWIHSELFGNLLFLDRKIVTFRRNWVELMKHFKFSKWAEFQFLFRLSERCCARSSDAVVANKRSKRIKSNGFPHSLALLWCSWAFELLGQSCNDVMCFKKKWYHSLLNAKLTNKLWTFSFCHL